MPLELKTASRKTTVTYTLSRRALADWVLEELKDLGAIGIDHKNTTIIINHGDASTINIKPAGYVESSAAPAFYVTLEKQP